MNYTNLAANENVNENGLIYELGSLYTYLERIVDPRHPKGKRYPLAMLLVLVMLAKLGGEDQPSGIADWVAHRRDELRALKLLSREQAPSHMTYRRVLQTIVDPIKVETLMSEYQRCYLKGGMSVVFSFDGKTVRGTIPSGELRGTHLTILATFSLSIPLLEQKYPLP